MVSDQHFRLALDIGTGFKGSKVEYIICRGLADYVSWSSMDNRKKGWLSILLLEDITYI